MNFLPESKLEIGHVAQITGLTAHAIRAWERRYAVIQPNRDGRRRYYSYSEVKRLQELKALVESGIPIRKAAKMSPEEIAKVLPQSESRLQRQRNHLIVSLREFQLSEITNQLREHRHRRGIEDFLINLVWPLLHEVGHLVEGGEISIAQEHALSAIIRDQIARIRPPKSTDDETPKIAFCTPEGDFHEFGILIASKLAEARDFTTLYLGPNLPAVSLQSTLLALRPKVVVIGATVLTSNCSHLDQYLHEGTRDCDCELWIGGPLALSTSHDVRAISGPQEFLHSLDQLEKKLK